MVGLVVCVLTGHPLVYKKLVSDGLYERDVLAWSQHQADLLRRVGRGKR